ncbi:uncharacterized mitochondrial protein AtMg00820-like [Malania oleifera]|uniref:uncharacterized mitochondrial protein AtMg00820-like n=1 Tax=Malania oleifera TaxID=397392 RepID=UPI0025ADF854|nr:uncharacterized mitochondrial protein AtMg00820-like [Malania oleifera]
MSTTQLSLKLATAEEPPVLRSHQMTTRSQNHIVKPKTFTNGIVRYPLPQSFFVASGVPDFPMNYTEASKYSEWRNAMDEEFTTLMKNGTWSLVPSKPNMNIVDSKCIFKSKHKANGTLECHKAQLVAKGYHQQPKFDFDDTFTPVVKPTTI